MKLNVEGISQGKRVLEAEFTTKQLGYTDSDLNFLTKVWIKANITRMGDEVLAECDFRTTVEQTCCRCLENYPLIINTDFQTLYDPEKPSRSFRRDVRRPIISDEDDSIVRYKGKEIDLSPEIMGATQLFIPMKALCREECKGICPHCGANLNETECRCAQESEKVTNNPFKDLHLKFEDGE